MYTVHLRLIGKMLVDHLLVISCTFSPGVTGEMLRANIDSKSAFFEGIGQFGPKFQVKGTSPPTIYARIDRPVNALQLCRWVFTQRNFVADFFLDRSAVLFQKRSFCVFEPPLGYLKATYAVQVKLIGKCVLRSGLPIADNWTFFYRCYSWGLTSEYRLELAVFEGGGSLWPKISGRRGRTPPTILRVKKTSCIDLSYHLV